MKQMGYTDMYVMQVWASYYVNKNVYHVNAYWSSSWLVNKCSTLVHWKLIQCGEKCSCNIQAAQPINKRLHGKRDWPHKTNRR